MGIIRPKSGLTTSDAFLTRHGGGHPYLWSFRGRAGVYVCVPSFPLRADRPPSGLDENRMIPWLWAIYVSVLLWLTAAVGNIALFALRSAEHWPVSETVEGLQAASLIPIALLMHRINRRSRQSAVVSVAATSDVAWRRPQLRLRKRAADVRNGHDCGIRRHPRAGRDTRLALRYKRPSLAGRALPRNLALLGMAAALTITLLIPSGRRGWQ